MNKVKLKTIAVLLGLSITAFGQDSKLVLSLQDAINYALENNKTLHNARTEVEVKNEGVNEAFSGILPQVTAKVDYMTYFGYELDFNLGSTDVDPALAQEAMNQTLTQYPTWNTSDYLASQAFESTLSSLMPSTAIKMTDQLMGNVQVGQLIFNGQFFVGLQTAKMAKKLAEKSVISVELDVKENVMNSYYLVLISEETLKIIDQNVENLEEVLDKTQAMLNAGVAEATDVDQIRMQVTLLENTRRSMKRTVQLNYNLLRFQLGTAPDANIELSQDLHDFLNGNVAMMTADVDFNYENNITYQLATSQTDLMDKMVSMQKWNYGPTVTGFYSYNAKVLTSGFDMNPNHAAGATISIPVFTGLDRVAKVNKAQLELDKARMNQSMVIDQLLLQEKQLRFEMQNALDNYMSQKENVEVAKRVYDSINRKFTYGMSSSLDLTNANNNYLQAESNFIQSQLTLLQAQLNLNKLMNSL